MHRKMQFSVTSFDDVLFSLSPGQDKVQGNDNKGLPEHAQGFHWALPWRQHWQGCGDAMNKCFKYM